MSRGMARARRVLVVAALVSTAGRAHADGPAAPRKGQLDADAPLPLVLSAADGVPVDEAQLHFRRGVQLYADGDPAGALGELRRAYALVPSYRVLFNLGQVAYQCGDHAAAFGYLTRYLTEGGNQLPDARRKEVARDLSALRAWVGFLSIETKEPALRVTVDDADVGTSPLSAPIAANAGRRRIEIAARSGERQTRIVDLSAGEILSVAFGPVGSAVAPAPTRASEAQAPLPVIEAPRPPSPAPPPVILAPRLPTTSTAPGPVAATPVARDRRASGTPWVTWALAAVAAGGAAATGALAWSSSQSLHDRAATYPARASELQDLRAREQRYALASDGLLAGAVVLSAIALYLTLTRPSPSDVAPSAAAASQTRW